MKWILLALALAGCARSTNGANDRDLSVLGGGGNPGDGTGGNGNGNGATADLSTGGIADLTSASQDLTLVSEDMTSVSDLALAAPVDMAHSIVDMAQPPADMTQPSSDLDVHILIDNFCNTSTNPTVINAPLHVALNLTFHNDSVDYDSDIWSSRGYGELGLTKGTSWKDPIQHCLNPTPYTEYFDVGIAGGPVGNSCPNDRLYIHCN
jgi:hypothetical protein